MNSTLFLEFDQICKNFGRLRANENISFSVNSGSIHALVGENGAGKSTLMKILFGIYQPDSGSIKVNGLVARIANPAFAKQLGIGMVHQHFMLAGPISALDHVLLDSNRAPQNASNFSPLPRARVLAQLQALSKQLNMPVDWESPIEKLPIGIQQRIEILKLLYNQSNLLILDEPTAVLTPQEISEFLNHLKAIRAQGKTIILITHKLKEVFAVADDITVLRKGATVRSAPLANWSIDELTEAMIGHPFTESSVAPSRFTDTNHPALQFSSEKMNFKVQSGEIVGIAGVEGNGQSELIKAIIAPQTFFKKKQVHLGATNISNLSSLEIRKLGLGYLPEDRQAMAISLDSNLESNFLLGQLYRFTKFGFIDRKKLRLKLKDTLKTFDVKYTSLTQTIRELSGGNQQKLVVARELSHPLKLLLASHPTRGVDINSIQHIHRAILMTRDTGTGILLISSELDELMKLSDRILVLYRGQFVREFLRSEFEENQIGAAMAGLVK